MLREFGDAEIATLIAPRGLVVEYSEGPRVEGPPAVPKGRRGGAAVGKLGTPAPGESGASGSGSTRSCPRASRSASSSTGTAAAAETSSARRPCGRFARLLGVRLEDGTARGGRRPTGGRPSIPDERQRRQVKELEDHVQHLLRGADATRNAFFLEHTTLIRTLAPRGERFRMFRVPEQSAEVFAREVEPFTKIFAEDVIGRIDDPVLPPDPRMRARSTTSRSGPATR